LNSQKVSSTPCEDELILTIMKVKNSKVEDMPLQFHSDHMLCCSKKLLNFCSVFLSNSDSWWIEEICGCH
jgi:hypothetical protein